MNSIQKVLTGMSLGVLGTLFLSGHVIADDNTHLQVSDTVALKSHQSPVDHWLTDKSAQLTPQSKPVNWKFAHPAPPVSHLPPVWQKSFDWLETASNNSIKLKMYGGGSLYGFSGGFKAIRAGVADFGTCYTVAEPKGFELLKTLHVPFVAPTNPFLLSRIVNDLMAEEFNQEFKRRGVYPGHIIPVRPVSLMSKEPIKTPDDLRGKKVVSFLSAPGAAKALGYSEVRVPFPEIYTALQQGIADAVLWIDMGFVPFKIYEQAKFYTEINLAPGTIETCMNRRSFDRLSKDQKQLVADFQQKVGIAVVEQTENFVEKAYKVYAENGVTILTLTAEERNEWKSAFEPVKEQWMASCKKAGKNCQGLVEKVKQLEQKYQALSNEELMKMAIDEPVQGIYKF